MKKLSHSLSMALLLIVAVLILAACSSESSAPTAPVQTPTTEVAPTVVPATNTPLPTETATEAPTFTATPTVLPTEEVKARYLSNSHVYKTSSTVLLSMSVTSGDFYGVATSSVSEVKYTCKFDSINLNYLVCSGENVPLDTLIDFKLYRKESDEQIFEGIITFPREKTLPAGMTCEIEPQWNTTGESQHELGEGCFAASCWKDGQFFWGSNNTCVKPWPFEWDFPHPLATFMPPVK
jgi:hypothetical protein